MPYVPARQAVTRVAAPTADTDSTANLPAKYRVPRPIVPSIVEALEGRTLPSAVPFKLGVNFGSDRADANGAPFILAPTDSAGVVPIQHWNNQSGAIGAATALTDSTGAASSVGISWATNGTWDAAIQEGMTDQFPAGPDHELMAGYLDNFGGTAPATVFNLGDRTPAPLDGNGILITGLSSAKAYDIYVYSLQAVVGRNSNITAIGDIAITQSITTSGQVSTYVSGKTGDYLLFPAMWPSASGDILIIPDGVTFRTPFQGIEVSEVVPEPAALGLLGLATLACLTRPRRRTSGHKSTTREGERPQRWRFVVPFEL